MKKTKEAVSLIVLVLTIVIMIILGGVIILNLSNSGIIDKAYNEVNATNLNEMKELASIGWAISYGKGARTKEALKAGVMAYVSSCGLAQEVIDSYTFNVTTKGVDVTAGAPLIIPEGATYYRYDKGFKYSEDVIPDWDWTYGWLYLDEKDCTKYNAGQQFPGPPQVGDTLKYEGYKYVYSCTRDWELADGYETWEEAEFNGWSVIYMNENEEEPAALLESINGAPLVNMEATFAYTQMTTAPVIPSSVTNMYCTFIGCEYLTGSVTINGTPNNYNFCLSYTEITEILGDCDEDIKEAILATVDEEW